MYLEKAHGGALGNRPEFDHIDAYARFIRANPANDIRVDVPCIDACR